MSNFSVWLEENCRIRPEKVAVHFPPSETWTFRNLHEAVCALTASLRNCFEPGDRIAIFLGNAPEFIIANLAVVRAGMIAVPLDARFQKFELLWHLCDARAVCLITGRHGARIFQEIPSGTTAVKKMIIAHREPAHPLRWEGINWAPFLSEGEPLSPEAVAQINYTASDGIRGAMLTHVNLLANCAMNVAAMHIREEDHFISTIPLSHPYGAMTSCFAPLSVGASVYLQPYFAPKNFLKAIRDSLITVIVAVPTVFAALLFHEAFDASCFCSVQLMVSGGASLPELIYREYRKLGLKINQGYGLTECSPSVTFTPLQGPEKPGTIGLPLPGVSLKIITEKGNEASAGEEGELLVKGPSVMKGYWNQPELTARTLESGWLHTGDKAKRDEDGYYYITGRFKNIIISGGLTISPKEIESLLGSHPAIARVSVSGVPDLVYGELIRASVYLKPGHTLTERDLASYARQMMAFYKIPRIIEIHPSPL